MIIHNSYLFPNFLNDFQHTLRFSPYSETEIKTILRERVGNTICATSAIEYIAKTVMKGSGDLRRAMETMTNAIQSALDNAKQDITTDGPLVLMSHVIETLKSSNSARTMKDRIVGLPNAGKFMMCVLCRVAQSSERISMKGQELRNEITLHITENQLDEENILEKTEFNVLLDTLADSGLIRYDDSKKHNNSNTDKSQRYVQLGVPSDEIKQAFRNDSLHSYYQKILGDNY